MEPGGEPGNRGPGLRECRRCCVRQGLRAVPGVGSDALAPAGMDGSPAGADRGVAGPAVGSMAQAADVAAWGGVPAHAQGPFFQLAVMRPCWSAARVGAEPCPCSGLSHVEPRALRRSAGEGGLCGAPAAQAAGGGQCSARMSRDSPLTIRAMAQPSNSPHGRILIFPGLPGNVTFGG